ncbi:TIGR03663 family protein [bacterium]|nr:TIGR03663 family protein [bacterium]
MTVSAIRDQNDRIAITITPFLILILITTSFLLFTHFYRLDSKPIHHDESIHAKNSYDLIHGKGYRYDPVYHGPFLYYFTAVVFFLTGDSDYTARLSPALFGLGLFVLSVLLARMRIWSGRQNYWLPVFIALSPTLTFFSRCLIMDIFSCFFAVLLIYATLLYVRTKNDNYILLMACALTLLFCIKENAHITAFIFCGFLVILVIWSHIYAERSSQKPGLRRLWNRSQWFETIDDSIVKYHHLAKIMVILAVIECSRFGFVLLKQSQFYDDLDKAVKLMVAMLFITLVLVAVALLYLGLEFLVIKRQKEHFSCFSTDSLNRNEPVFMFYMVVIILFALFYTSFLQEPGRLSDGLLSGISYWLGQHSNPRIPGPFSYYFPILLVYETPLLIIMLLGILCNLSFLRILSLPLVLGLGWILSSPRVMGIKWLQPEKYDLTNLEGGLVLTMLWLLLLGLHQLLSKKRVLEAFFLFWSIMALLFYGFANEKVPWLATHLVLPQIFLASAFLTRFFSRDKSHYLKFVVLLGLIIGLGYVMRSTIMLNFYHESDPREIMVYVHSSKDVPAVVRHIEELQFRLGPDHEFKIILEDDANWPFVWYLRNHKVIFQNSINRFDADVIIARSNPPQSFINELAKQGFKGQRYRLRAWWIVEWKKLFQQSWSNIFTSLRKYLLYREMFLGEPGSTDFLYYYLDRDADNQSNSDRSAEETESTGEQKPATLIDNHDGPDPNGDQETQESPLVQSPMAERVLGTSENFQKGLRGPRDLEIGPSQTIYVVDAGYNRIQIYDKDGQWLKSIGTKGEGPGQFNNPQGIAIGPDGTLFVADTWNHRIQKFSPQGTFLGQFGQEQDMWGPRDIEINSQGELIVSDTGKTRILVFNSEGYLIREWGYKGEKPGYLTEAVGLALTAHDDIAVADCGNKRVQFFKPDGTFISTFRVDGWENYYSEPYLAIDHAGRVFLTDPENDRILVYSSQGKLLAILSDSGSQYGQLNKPKGIACFEDYYYVSDSLNNRVQVFQSPFQ